ncbi:MAG: hypothetical protein CSA50_02110 [Gammaproteobacteria bacterium]|nr:MAG: hypothetical protein CSA50_02110 [Gammaproteobacteria bacterium]
MYLKKPVNKFSSTGLGLPVALFVITVMAFIALAINKLGSTGAKSVSVNLLSARAFYAAESGIDIMLAINGGNPPACSVAGTTIDITNMAAGLARCRARVTCTTTSPATTYLLQSTGSCGSGVDQATRIVRVVVE